ncbi:MAG: SRPBCC domain-containing protein [Steroidobacteraceae bacterium]|jgi:uncharacterized protein YndB with AHSA1/START domain
MADRTRGYAHRIDILAPPALVWRALLEPELLAEWYAPGARVSARAGGSFEIRLEGNLVREAHIDVFDPGRRLRLIYLPPEDLPPSEHVIVDDFILSEEPGTAVLRLLGSGFPADDYEWEQLYLRLRAGWGLALARMKVSLERRVKAGTG